MVTARAWLPFGLLLTAAILLILVLEADVLLDRLTTNMGMVALTKAAVTTKDGEIGSVSRAYAQQAVTRFERVDSDERATRTNFWLGYAHLLDNQSEKAVARWQRVRPLAIRTLIQYATNSAKAEAGGPPDHDWLSLAYQVAPDSAEVALQLGFKEAAQYDWAAALLWFERAAENEAAATDQTVRADAYYHASLLLADELGDMGAAERYAKSAIALDAAHVEALIGLGNIYFDTGRHLDAIAQYAAAIELEPAQFESRAQIGRSLLALKRYDEAVTQLEMASGLYHRDPWLSLQLGDAYRESGQPTKAMAQYRQVIQLAPGDQVAETAAAYLAHLERQK